MLNELASINLKGSEGVYEWMLPNPNDFSFTYCTRDPFHSSDHYLSYNRCCCRWPNHFKVKFVTIIIST